VFLLQAFLIGKSSFVRINKVIRSLSATTVSFFIVFINFKMENPINYFNRMSWRLTILFLIHFLSGSLIAQTTCPTCPSNLSFENGDFSSWTGIYGNYVFPIPTPVSNPAFKYQATGTGTPAQRYEIMSGTGTDPNISALPVKAPCGSKYSVRLGFTGSPESQGNGNFPYFESLTYNLKVTQQTAGFSYMYAVVLVDGSHDKFTQPEFDVIMMTCSDSTVLPCGQYSIYAGNGSSEFKTVGKFQYTDWTTVTTDLSGYIGQQVCITFRVRDCMGNLSSTNGNYSAVSGGGHQGYAYIDTYCAPVAQITHPEFCAGVASLQICAPPGYKSYSWPAGQPGLSGSPTTQCVTVNNPVEGTNYTVTMMSYSGCPVTITIPIHGIPTTSSADSVHSCAGDADTLSIKATGNEGPYTYTWSHNLGTNNTVIVKPTVTTTYTVTVTNAKNCSSKKSFTVIVDPCNREMEINGGIICKGDSVLMVPKITGAISPYTYNWQPVNATSPTLTVKPATTTTYTLTVKDATGFVMTDTAIVIVKPTPTVTVNSDTICAGQVATFTANGADTYKWPAGFTVNGNSATVTPTGTASYVLTGTTGGCSATAIFHVVVNAAFSVSVNSPELCAGDSITLKATGALVYTWLPSGTKGSTIIVSPAATVTYTVIGTDLSGGCADTAFSNVSVNPLPVVTVNAPIICAGEKALLTANGATTYVWPSGITSTGTNTASASPAVTTTYTVTGTSKGCSDTTAFTITVKKSPNVKATGAVICAGEIAKLIATGATTYTWYPSQYLSSATDSIVFATPPITKTYILTGVTNNCIDTAMITVVVNPLPDVVVNSPKICSGKTAILIANGATTYSWSPGTTYLAPEKVSAAPLSTTSYTVTGYKAGCKDSAIAVVTVNPSPTANFNGPFQGCAPLTVNFLNSSSNSTAYVWTLGDGTTSSLKDPVHVYNEAGSYTVSLIAKNATCLDTLIKTAVVNVYPIPKAILAVDKDVVYESDPTVLFTDQSIQAQNCWLNFGDGSLVTNSCDFSIEHLYGANKTYCAVLMVESEHQCKDTTEVCIEVKPETTFYIPNSFTLNNDGKNELFKAYGTNITEFQMLIFNRWGEKIFESNDLDKGWNGKYRNNEGAALSQEDVYVCKVMYKDIRYKTHYYYGTVTIVR
jgi:gliding motility-associated-like protein